MTIVDTSPGDNVRVTFRTTRGSFTLAAELFEDGAESDLAYAFASSMPPGARSAGRTVDAAGNVTVSWRKIRVVRLS